MSKLVIADLPVLENLDAQEMNELQGGFVFTPGADSAVIFAGSADNHGNISGAGATIDDPVFGTTAIGGFNAYGAPVSQVIV